MPAAPASREGAWFWRAGNGAKPGFRAVDGTEVEASALSPHDVVGLAAATGAPNVRFDLAVGVSSSRRRGEPMSSSNSAGRTTRAGRSEPATRSSTPAGRRR